MEAYTLIVGNTTIEFPENIMDIYPALSEYINSNGDVELPEQYEESVVLMMTLDIEAKIDELSIEEKSSLRRIAYIFGDIEFGDLITESMSLVSLPPDSLVIIASGMRYGDIINLCQTNKEMETLCRSVDFWKSIFIKKFGMGFNGTSQQIKNEILKRETENGIYSRGSERYISAEDIIDRYMNRMAVNLNDIPYFMDRTIFDMITYPEINARIYGSVLIEALEGGNEELITLSLKKLALNKNFNHLDFVAVGKILERAITYGDTKIIRQVNSFINGRTDKESVFLTATKFFVTMGKYEHYNTLKKLQPTMFKKVLRRAASSLFGDAISGGNLNIVKDLVEHVEVTNNYLTIAANNYRIEVLKYLIGLGLKPDISTILAIMKKGTLEDYLNMVKLADLDEKDVFRMLTSAIYEAKEDIALNIIENYELGGPSDMVGAVVSNLPNVAALLIDRGNVVTQRLIDMAVKKGNADVLDLLLRNISNTEVTDLNSLLNTSAVNNDLGVALVLINHGASDLEKAADFADDYGHPEFAKILRAKK